MVYITHYVLGLACSLLVAPCVVDARVTARAAALQKLSIEQRYQVTWDISEDPKNKITKAEWIKRANTAYDESREILKVEYDAVTELQSPPNLELKDKDQLSRRKIEDLFKKFFGVPLKETKKLKKVQENFEKMLTQQKSDGESLYVGSKEIEFTGRNPAVDSQWYMEKLMLRIYPKKKQIQMHQDALRGDIDLRHARDNFADLSRAFKPFGRKTLDNHLGDIRSQGTILLRAGIHMYFAIANKKDGESFNKEILGAGRDLPLALARIYDETAKRAINSKAQNPEKMGGEDFTKNPDSYYAFALAASAGDYDVDPRTDQIIKVKKRPEQAPENVYRDW